MSNSPRQTSQSRHITVNAEDQSLSLVDAEVPTPSDNEVLISVKCAGVNRADILQRKGLYPPPSDASAILGLEVAGTVVAVGEDVQDWRSGDRICALTHGGGYAEFAVAPIGQCFPIPEGFSDIEAAALPEALFTIWHNIFQRGRMQPGDNVLIHGGASGMGTMGIMMARALGARVYTTAGSSEKCSRLEALGAECAINYKEDDFEVVLQDLGVANGINVILDMVGGDYVQKNINIAAPEGRIINIAYMNGFKAEINFAPLLMKRLTLTGSTLRAQTFAQKAKMREEIIAQVYPHLNDGSIRPVVDRTFPLPAAADAHDYMLSGEHMGKIILLVNE